MFRDVNVHHRRILQITFYVVNVYWIIQLTPATIRNDVFGSLAKEVLLFWGNYWQFRLSRLLIRFFICIKEIKLLTSRKIKKFEFGLLYVSSMKTITICTFYINLFLL